MVREAFIRDRREEQVPAHGRGSRESSRQGCLLSCIFCTPHASWGLEQGASLGLS